MDFDDLDEAEDNRISEDAENARKEAEALAAAAEEAAKKAEEEALAKGKSTFWTPWVPISEEKFDKWPKGGDHNRPLNMKQFKEVQNLSEPGEFHGMIFPHTPTQLKEMGPKWLTEAMHKKGTLPLDNEITKFVKFDVKAEDVTQNQGDAESTDWGGAGLKILLQVKYKNGPGDLTEAMFIKMPHAFTGKNERFKNSVTQGLGDFYENMFYNTIGGRLPARTPRCYFADVCRRTTNFILIIESIPYGPKSRKDAKPGEYFAAPGKYKDWEIPHIADFYYAHARALAQFFGWHYQVRKMTDQIEFCFADQGFLNGKKFLFDTLGKKTPAERDEWFVNVANKDPNLIPWVKGQGFAPEQALSFLEIAKDFLNKTGHMFPKEYQDKKFIDKMFKEANDIGKYCAEINFYMGMIPEYFTLAHPNAQIDNAWYWRDEDGKVEAGLLDWGGCSHQSIPTCVGMAWIGAEGDLMDEHEEKLVQFLIDEYEKTTGVKLDFQHLHMCIKLAQGSIMPGCCANIGMLLRIFQKTEWAGMKNRFDDKINSNFLARCYFVQIELFFAMWKKRAPYKAWEKWMKLTKLPKK